MSGWQKSPLDLGKELLDKARAGAGRNPSGWVPCKMGLHPVDGTLCACGHPKKHSIQDYPDELADELKLIWAETHDKAEFEDLTTTQQGELSPVGGGT